MSGSLEAAETLAAATVDPGVAELVIAAIGTLAAAHMAFPLADAWIVANPALVASIDRISLERQSPATMSVWRAALEALHGPEQQKLL